MALIYLTTKWRRWRRWLAAARSDGAVAGDLGGKGDRGVAHQNRHDVLVLNVVVAGQGAHGRVGNLSPELLSGTGTHGRGRRRASGSQLIK